MNQLPLDMLYEILYYLPNESIIYMPNVCKYLKIVTDNELFREYILFRPHPMVFNLVDNYCRVCNIGYPYPFSKYEGRYTQCNHI